MLSQSCRGGLGLSCAGVGGPSRHAAGTASSGRRPQLHVSAAFGGFSLPNPGYGGGDCAGERFHSLFAAELLPPTNNPPCILDARDALETCTGIWGEERQACMAVFGVDPEVVDKWFPVVEALEHSLELDTDPEEEAHHRGQERC